MARTKPVRLLGELEHYRPLLARTSGPETAAALWKLIALAGQLLQAKR